MTEIGAYRRMIHGASNNLRDAVASVSDEDFGKRPVEGANPVNFIYFHVLRHWDRDINIYIQQQDPAADAWHRHGMSEALDYEPVGKGSEGIGTGYGYSDAEVDGLPTDPKDLRRYQDILERETEDLLDRLDPETLDDPMELEGRAYSIGQRLRHLVAHTYLHLGDIEYAKGLLGAPAGDFPTLE
ncbi:MAG: DinB family protein [Thermomicrobiales bacterium]